MESYKHKTVILPSALSLFMFLIFSVVNVGAQTLPPARTDGFVYKNHRVNSDTIIIEAFYDPVCPDSRDSWPPLKKALHYFGSHTWLVVHLLPLPSVSNLSLSLNSSFFFFSSLNQIAFWFFQFHILITSTDDTKLFIFWNLDECPMCFNKWELDSAAIVKSKGNLCHKFMTWANILY